MKLIIHIGGPKCGSTAIQAAIAANAQVMRAKGVLVPGNELDDSPRVDGYQLYYFERMAKSPDGSADVRSRLGKLADIMQTEKLHTLVVSAENLIDVTDLGSDKPGAFVALFDGIQEVFEDIQIIAYVRRQDDFLISWWQQRGLLEYSSFEKFLEKSVGQMARWFDALEPWENRFGVGRIQLRVFQRENLTDGDVVADFFSCLNLPLTIRGDARLNRSHDEHLAEIVHRIHDRFDDTSTRKIFRDLEFAIGPSAFKNHSGSMLLTLSQRHSIMNVYAEDNAALALRHFPMRAPGDPIFKEPSENDVVTISRSDASRAERDILATAIVGLARRVQSLEVKCDRTTTVNSDEGTVN